jgi:transmembrane sensor
MQLPENILFLIEKYLSGTISEDEKTFLNQWYRSFNDHEVELKNDEDETEQALKSRIHARLLKTIHSEKPHRTISHHQWLRSAAAAVIVVLSVSLYLTFLYKSSKSELATKSETETKLKNDIAPGGNKAILTLANGSTILLDSASNGTLTHQGNIKVQKLANGLISYNKNAKQIIPNDQPVYNTISTPRGGEYQVTLSDGTKVWLNSASSINFPVAFNGKERKVIITGEAYFEVAKNKDKPFKVEANSTEVEVLGTHFNVNAYDDESSIKTTLLEGKVKVSVNGQSNHQSPEFLLPGQQADINKEGNIRIREDVDTEETVAWMHGHFQFTSADLQTILRQIARWYDVTIFYNGNIKLHFTGQLNKNLNVSKIFETLSLTNEVHFKIEDKKIIVTP